MKELTLTLSILLSVSIQIIAKPASCLPDQNKFQPVINPQKMRKQPDLSITESIHIKKQTKMKNATILHEANEFVKKGNYESFLAYCIQDTKWVFVGERILEGRDKVREYIEITLKAANGTYSFKKLPDLRLICKVGS